MLKSLFLVEILNVEEAKVKVKIVNFLQSSCYVFCGPEWQNSKILITVALVMVST